MTIRAEYFQVMNINFFHTRRDVQSRRNQLTKVHHEYETLLISTETVDADFHAILLRDL